MDPITLSKYDDLLSDVLLDQVGLWFTTRKMLPRHRKARVPDNQGLSIVKKVASGNTSLPEAVEELTRIEYITAFLRHKSQIRYQDFCLHAARYFSMYLPEAGYEVSLTSRYKAVSGQDEACVIATKPFMVGEIISLCSGSIACLDEANLRRMEKERADFSVMWWSKKKHMCLFLGPARFVNHDCDSNCRFTALGSDAICFQALKNIKPGEEITTHYGHSYFGTNNCECLCSSCERYGRGWFAKALGSPTRESNSINGKGMSSPPRKMRTRNGRRATISALNKTSPDTNMIACSNCKYTTCTISETPTPTNSEETSRDICIRCQRHKLLFGLNWPNRPESHIKKSRRKSTTNSNHKRSSAPSSNRKKRKLQASAEPEETNNEYLTSIYSDGNGTLPDLQKMYNRKLPGTPVFVDPLDQKMDMWWPAIIVNNGPEGLEVCYIENGSYSECHPDEVQLFNPFTEPFTGWFKNNPDMINIPVIRRAMCYFEWRFLAPLDRPSLPMVSKSTGLVNGYRQSHKRFKRERTPYSKHRTSTQSSIDTAVSGIESKLLSTNDHDKISNCGESVTTDDNSTTIVNIDSISATSASSPSPTPLSITPTTQTNASNINGIHNDKTLRTFQGLKYNKSTQLGVNEILQLAKTFPNSVDNDTWLLTLPPLQPDQFYITIPQPGVDALQTDDKAPNAAEEPPLHKCIAAYTLQVGDEAIIIDGRDAKPYHGRIEDVDIIYNEKRQGFFYYVHFKGWNRKFDEWVSPCRILKIVLQS
ncbi:histone lysine methyltransferase Set9 [Mycoemilia scoparia]|uniref:Histone lysine methyltransferase Set9 n=1 Tax=Mycoemilia scoparia TaxID=417184 RepID=A0A9W8DHY7_9FUNG|nr:histone lysine methyltransferase Set9 [Mycoemilia scoparia]